MAGDSSPLILHYIFRHFPDIAAMDSEEGWTNGHPPPLKPIEECFRIAATPPLFLHYDREDGNHCELFVIQDEEAIHFPVQSALLSIWPRAFSNLESVMFRGMWFYWADLRHSFSTVMSTVKHIIFLDVNLSGWPFEMSRAEALGRVPLLPNLGPDQSMQRILEVIAFSS